jgi:hypothetical protein
MRSPILAGQQGPINGEGGEVRVAPRLGAPPSLPPPVEAVRESACPPCCSLQPLNTV